MATYTKLKSGEWGLRISGVVAAGQSVSVTTRSGAVKTETVDRVLWSGNGIMVCLIRRREPAYERGSSQRSVEALYQRKYGWDGVRGSSSYYTVGMYDEES